MAWTMSAAAQTVLASGSYRAAFKAEVWAGSVYLQDLPILAGSVTEDETLEVRRTCTVDVDVTGVIGDPLIPATALSLLHPASGNELRLYRGVVIPGTSTVTDSVTVVGGGSFDSGGTYDSGGAFDNPGTGVTEVEVTTVTTATVVEYAPLGVFRMTVPATSDVPTGLSLTLTGNDRSSEITRRKWISPCTAVIGWTVDQAIQWILADRWGTNDPLVFNLTPSTVAVPAGTVLGLIVSGTGSSTQVTDSSSNDPWADCQTLATSAGMELFFDRTGTVVLRPVPEPGSSPLVVSFVEGQGCTMVELDRTLDSSSMCNGVVVIGTGATATVQTVEVPAAAVQAVAWDTNPASPTYYLGDFGQVPSFVTDSTVATVVAAQTSAQARLILALASLDETALQCVPNPAIDAGDSCYVVRARSAVDSTYVMSAITTPLDVTSNQQVTNRAASVVYASQLAA